MEVILESDGVTVVGATGAFTARSMGDSALRWVGGMTCATPPSWSRRGTATLVPWKRSLRSVRT
jgi:hypothetical protein